jgi:hypothetical protein
MSARRFAMLVVAAIVAISAAFYVSARRDQPREQPGVALLPSLADGLNSLSAMTIRKGNPSPTLTVHKRGAEWTVAERGDYPADVAKLRKLLLSLRDARIVEEKTANPAQFAVIGVEDPTQHGAGGAEVTVVGAGDRHSLIVGKPAGEGNFVRRTGENQTYSVEPAISFETEPRFWIDSRLIDVPVALIQGIEVKPAAGAAYSIHRLNPADNSFSIDGVPPGRKPLDAHAIAPSAATLADLNAEDVAPVGSIDFNQSSQAIVTLTDGNIITIIGAVIGDKHWIQVKSSKNAALTAKTGGRAFDVATYRYDAIFKPVEQLLVPKEAPAPKASPATKGAPPATGSAAPKALSAPPHASKKPVPAAAP